MVKIWSREGEAGRPERAYPLGWKKLAHMGTSETTLCLLPVARHSVGRSGGHLGRALESITYSGASQPFLIYFNIIKKILAFPCRAAG